MNSPVIQLRLKGRLLQTLPFEGDSLRIGRMKENDIVISNASVSRFHAVLRREDGQVYLEDSGSENGCYLNGARIAGRVALEPGDEVLIGKHQLVLKEGEDASPPEAREARNEKNDAWDASKTYFVGADTQAKLLESLGAEPGAVTDPEREADPSLDDLLAAVEAEATPEEIDPSSDELVVESLDDALEDVEPEPIAAEPGELPARTPAAEEPGQEGEVAVVADPGDPDEEGFEFGAAVDLEGAAAEGEQELDLRDYDVDPIDEEATEDAEQAIEIPGTPAAASEPAAEPVWHAGLIVQNRGRLDRIISWDRDQLVAGRARDCDIHLDEAEVSRRHAIFVREDGGYEVRDLDSVNGLLVNGEKTTRHRLELGDVVKIEAFEMTFLLDRHPICSEVKTAAPPGPMAAGAEDGLDVTVLDEELPSGPAVTNPSSIAEPPAQADGTEAPEVPAADLSGQAGTEEGADLPEPFAEALEAAGGVERVAEAPQPPAVGLYGPDDVEGEELIEVEEVSPPCCEVEFPGVPVVAEEVVELTVKLRLADLPEPLRAALAALEEAELKLPIEIALKADERD